MAKTSSRPIEPPQLQPLVERFNAWRARRTAGQRIPPELWNAAVQLVPILGVSRTATALKLSYYDLQRRLPQGHHRRQQRGSHPGFVELAAPARPLSWSEGGTVELVHRSGARLSLRLPQASARELLPLVQLFLRHRS